MSSDLEFWGVIWGFSDLIYLWGFVFRDQIYLWFLCPVIRVLGGDFGIQWFDLFVGFCVPRSDLFVIFMSSDESFGGDFGIQWFDLFVGFCVPRSDLFVIFMSSDSGGPGVGLSD